MAFTPLSDITSKPTPGFTPIDAAPPTPSTPTEGISNPFKTPPPSIASVAGTFASQISDQWNSGQQQIDQPFINKGTQGSSFTPIEAAEGALSVGSGVVTKVTAPLAPIFAAISKAVSSAGDALSNTSYLKGFGKDTASLPANQQTQPERILTDIINAANAGMAILGGAESLKGEAPLTKESAAQNYQSKVIEPAKTAGEPIVLGSDYLKDANGNDYNTDNHPIYSQATRDLFNKEVPQSPEDTVKMTAGGPGSGKTDFLLPKLKDNFKGVIYDSTLSDYKTLQDRLATIKAANKTPDVTGIIPNTEVARSFTKSRALSEGREIPNAYFDKTHAGVIDTLYKALKNGDLTPDQVHLLDTRNLTDANVIRDMLANNSYHPDPLALLEEVRYNKGNEQAALSRNELATGRRDQPLPVLGEGGPDKGQPANVAGGSSQVLQRTEGTARSKIGRSIEAKAVEAKLTEGFDKTAGYDRITIKEQAEKAAKLVNESPEEAGAIIRGEKPLPTGLKGTALITAMEEKLTKTPDAKTAYELANSPLVSETSEAAQELRLAAERNPDSITAKFDEIKRARKAAADKRGSVKKVTDDIQKEIKRTASKRPSWEQFVKDISCRV